LGKSVKIIAGIDLGSKLAGTTAVCIGNTEGKIHSVLQSKRKADADLFLVDIIKKSVVEMIFIDAPLSLPGVYAHPNNYNDYFFRICDREIGAMSPMFLGGLTARAMKLKGEWNQQDIAVYEVWPSKLAELVGISREIYKTSVENIPEVLSVLSKHSGKFPSDSIDTWHKFDSCLAYYSGIRYLTGKALKFGNQDEGIIYA